jgi:hypothetical protein
MKEVEMSRPITQTVLSLSLLLNLTCIAIAQTSTQGGVGKPVGPAKPTENAPMTVLPGASAKKDKENSSSSTTTRAAAKPLAPRQVPQTPRPLTKRLTLKERGVAIRHPEGWTVAPKRLQNLEELIYVSPDVTAKQAVSSLKITSEARRSHAEALRRLKEIAFGIGAPATAFLNVGNWPGFQYRRIEERPQPGEGEGGPRFADEKVLRVTTAAAAGNLLVRVEAALPSDADPGLIAEVEAIGRSLTFASKTIRPFQTEQELDEIRNNPRPDNVEPPTQKPDQVETKEPNTSLTATPDQSFAPGFTQRIFNGGQGELEIAVSPNARNIVIGRQSAFATSNDGGQTFPFSGFIAFSGGDPSLAWGQSGNFYYAGIRGGCLAADATGPNGYTCSGVARSTNNGQTFPNIFNANRCANNNNPAPPNLPGFCFPDQEHIAADRVNAGTGGGDQIYVTWRNFDATDQDPALVCTQDSGANWTAVPITVGTGAFPRINVGQDGFVYVVYLDGGNYMLNKYSSCASGMVQQVGFPVAVTTRSPVTCPFPGHDRCDQNPSSQMIAVDDTNPNHVYFVAGHNTAGNNDDIRVRDSLDGGLTWPGPRFVRVNSLVSGHRIMPWLCTTGGEAFVTWYDRRAAPPTNNDLTDYFGGRVSLDAGGNLVVGPETKISEVGDPWCASGWPCGTRSTGDSEQCSVQPQQAGICCGPAIPGNNCPGSNQRCDFSDMNCPAGETCSTGGGCPKYGDYNGNACAAGRLLAAYASLATPLRIQPPSVGISVLFSASLVGDVPQIQVPGSVSLADTCVGSSSTATMNVCNTGKANLEIAPAITSSNSQFSVTTPSAGYPVVISPDFCFPFQVRFTPTSTGSKTANLTIQSNDPSTNPLIVQATALASQQTISTFIADSGDFGNVCVGSFKDLDLTINNSGGCNLLISSITSSSTEFKTAQTINFPIVVQGGTSVHVPIRLQPTTTGPKSANITISSNDPFNPGKVVAVTGHADPGDIRVTGSTDFGDVCAGAFAEKTVQVCNAGTCDLHVTSASLGSCTDFQLVNNPFPATVSHDSCLGVTVRFTPTSAGPKSCTLTINSDDPDTPSIMKTVSADTPLASIDVSEDQNFPPEVIQSAGMCRTLQPFPISNKGTCNLKITSITTGGINGTDFSTSGLPSFPIILQPGHTVGDGNLMTVFAPTAIDRDRLGTLSVTYESDPITHASVQVVRNLCGEGVLTGARVLVTAGGVPVSVVEKLQINRINANRNKDQVDSVDNAMNLPLQTVNPAPPCASFQFHREYGTVSNPIQLLPGSYVLTATAIVNGSRQTLTVAFDVTTCDFNPTIVVNLP